MYHEYSKKKKKTDPTQFLQIHGRKCKIHIDTSSGGQVKYLCCCLPCSNDTI